VHQEAGRRRLTQRSIHYSFSNHSEATTLQVSSMLCDLLRRQRSSFSVLARHVLPSQRWAGNLCANRQERSRLPRLQADTTNKKNEVDGKLKESGSCNSNAHRKRLFMESLVRKKSTCRAEGVRVYAFARV
jgi:hypothetical protein